MPHNDPAAKRGERWIAAALALLVWQGAAMLADNPLLLTTPLATAARLWTLLGEPAFRTALGASFVRIVGGFLIGLCVAAILGALSVRYRRVGVLLAPYVSVIRSVPAVSFIVIALLWLSARGVSLFIAFLMVFPVLYANITEGLRAADSALLEMAAVFRMPWGARIRSIYIPALRPYLLAAEKTALGLCWKAGVAAEVIGVAKDTVGGRLYDAKVYLETADLFAWTVVIVLVSAGFEWLFLRLTERVLAKWEGR